MSLWAQIHRTYLLLTTSRQLRGFHLVAQHGSFSRTAEALFITPSGLSLLIRELENQLGFRLFDRTTRHVQLTALGSELLQVTRRSVQDLDAVIARLGQTARGVTRFISVGVTPLVVAGARIPRSPRARACGSAARARTRLAFRGKSSSGLSVGAPLLIAGPRPRDEVEPRERNRLTRSLAHPEPFGVAM